MLLKRITETLNNSYIFALVIVTIWSIFSLFGTVFQCQVPEPWTYVPSKCKYQGPIQYAIITFNILTDSMLAMGMLPTIWKLSLKKNIRVTIMVLFGIRLVYVFSVLH